MKYNERLLCLSNLTLLMTNQISELNVGLPHEQTSGSSVVRCQTNQKQG